jgi:hypothetical protein
MTESIQFPFMPITLDTCSTHTRRYIASTLMLGFCMNHYATCFASSPPHGMYSYFIMFLQRIIEREAITSKHKRRLFSLVATSWIDHFEYQHTQPS